MAEDIKNVFISHVHEDDDGLADLKELIGKGGLTVRDSSINSSDPNDAKNPDYIKSQILAPQIQWASTLLVYMLNVEIRLAMRGSVESKRVV